MSVLESLSDQSIRRTLNSDPNFERLRYLVVLAAAAEPPFVTGGTDIDGRVTFNVKQLWRVANRLGLDYERYRGADRVFKLLEKSGLVSAIKNEETQSHTQYYTTELGIAQTRLNLDRLRKIQEFESQAKTMQMTIKKQIASKAPPAILEISLGPNVFSIGRDDDNNLSVDDPYLSSKHARVVYDSGKWVFEDLGSRNGSWKIVEPNNLLRVVRTELFDNDMYQLGSTILRFRRTKIHP
jgi:FHA domain